MASASSGAAAFSRLVDRTRVPDPALQRHAVAAFFRHLLTLPAPLPAAAHDGISSLLASPHAAVAAYASASLARLAASRADLLAPDHALPFLLAPLSASPSPRLASCLVKAVAALVSCALRSGSRFPPHNHPFVQALASGADGARAELPRQAARMVAQGVDGVVGFLRPFVMFAVVRKGDAAFARDLIGALAGAAATAAAKPDAAVPLLKLVGESLLHFGRRGEEEARLWLSSVECLVDAYVILLRKLAHAQKPSYDAQASSVDLVETLLSQCSLHHQLLGMAGVVLGLSKYLFSVQKDIGLCYLPEISGVLSSLSCILSGLEFEHEQLAGLKLLAFLIEWRHENALKTNESVHHFSEELLCLLPVINLVISPSRYVKEVASHVLSIFSLLVLELPASCSSEQQDFSMVHHISKPTFILPKLVHHLWSQSASGFFFTKHATCKGLPESSANYSEANYWTEETNEYLSVLAREKLALDGSSSKKMSSVAMSSLLSSAVSVLVMHPKLGTSAAQSLGILGASDPKLGMPLLLVILFYCKIIYSNDNLSTNSLLSLLESLPSLATHGFVLPLALQFISPMLKKDAKPILYAIAVRLLCKIWIITDWAFPNLQGILEPEAFSSFTTDKEVLTSIAASLRDVCKQNPDRGVDLILSVSSCIESRDSVVQALGLESLSYLCEADVIDFYTAWRVISKDLLDYSIDPTVSNSLCILLRWGAMDAEAYSETSKNLIQTLWSIGTYKKNNAEADRLWIKARGAAFQSLSQYKVSLIQDSIPDFLRRNHECFTNEHNLEVLKAMENFQVEIIKFEHINRRRVTAEKRTTVHKFEKLLDVLPQAVFKQKSAQHRLPGAALLTINYTPDDIVREGKSKDLPRVHAAYEQALVDMAESMFISRNMVVALFALHSWKSFVSHWMQAVVALLDTKESSKLNKPLKAANDIFKILCKCVPVSNPRVAVNITLAIGALCLVVPPTAHLVVSSASDFLLKWLLQYEHEHQQWSAAVSLGLIFNCFHPTDKKSKLQVVSGLFEVISKTDSCLVKGACGLGLGYACQGLLTRAESTADSELEATSELKERASVKEILHTMTASIVKLCPSSCYSLKKLSVCGIFSMEGMEENYGSLDDDPWAIAGLVLGLGNSVIALYRLGAYEDVIELKNILISWIPDVDSSSELFGEINSVSLCMGSCLALPSVIAFCQRVELLNDDLDALFNRYTSLATELLNLKKSGSVFQNLLMAVCIGAGSLLSCILNDGVHSMKSADVKKFLDILRNIYTHPYPPLVHLGGMFGAVNAFGAGAGDLIGICSKSMNSQIKHEKESSLLRGPLLTSPVGETLSTAMIQEISLLAKDAEDNQIQNYAAWAISFLRSRWLLKNQSLHDDDSSQRISIDSTSLSPESLVWNLSLWLRDLNFEKPGDVVPVNTIATVLKCLTKAPRLPVIDWGVIVRRCMKVEAHIPHTSSNHQDPKLLREECLYFSLAHADHISPLLQFLDDLTDLPRFRRLEMNMQSVLLQYLSHLMKLFSDSRSKKLYDDLTVYFYSLSSSYLDYSSEQRSMLRMSFWKGICKCLVELISEESDSFSYVKKCIECLLTLLNLCNDGQPEFMDEWSAAIKCLMVAPKSWLDDMLQVHNTASLGEGEHVDAAKKIIIRARLCSTGCVSALELGNIKTTILSTPADGVWWNVLVEVATAVYSADNGIKKQWLLDALDTGCVTAHPSTALRFVGLLCGSCCIYMPLLIVNPTNVLSDFPVTLPSFLSSSIWDDLRNSAADKLWLLTTRIYTWAEQLTRGEGLSCYDHIHESEADNATFLANMLRSTCIAVEDHLAADKQLKLANLEAL
ncbi:protein RST1 isoform X1 [Lolium perenne]|uniref:protein RST1 isoform X1 n=1 Tax=Lolium perenne TaxID=4522 RepID=UPI0021EA808D|nr:protein RST1 isoform X1 [Lolium perenne]